MPMTFGTLSLNFWSSTKQRMPMAMPGRLMPPASVMQVWRQRPTRTPSTMPMQTGLTIFMI